MSETKEAPSVEDSGLIVTQPGEIQKTNPDSDAARAELDAAVKAAKPSSSKAKTEGNSGGSTPAPAKKATAAQKKAAAAEKAAAEKAAATGGHPRTSLVS